MGRVSGARPMSDGKRGGGEMVPFRAVRRERRKEEGSGYGRHGLLEPCGWRQWQGAMRLGFLSEHGAACRAEMGREVGAERDE
ncbi:hypothetical protein NL676_010809 [Syzygium grande]|nr:hypothetical protein NL676_010809 [Syzygium grande]